MKSFIEFLNEETTTMDRPEEVVDAWKNVVEYDAKMKQKFSYFDVAYKSKAFTTGHKGQLTKVHKKFENSMSDNKLDPNITIKKLMHLYPPKYIQ